MKDILITLLSAFNFPVYLQGSLAANAPYPDNFFTFWNTETENQFYFDNKPLICVWYVRLCFYSIDPDSTNSVLLSAIETLKAAGWIISGKGYDVASDEPTHTGRAVDLIYIDKYGAQPAADDSEGEN